MEKKETKEENKSSIKNLHISKDESIILVNQMQNSICNIYNNRKNGVGFFCLFPYKSKILPFLITNEHVLNENDLNNNKKIMISLKNYKKENIVKNINIEKKRIIYIDKELEATLIEIKPNYDKIDTNNCIEIDNNIYQDEKIINGIYLNKPVYILYYPKKDNNIIMKHGLLSDISKTTIYHLCNGGSHSSGSPILLLESKKIIGINLGMKGDKDYNLGIFMKPLVTKLNKLKERHKLEKNISNIDIKNELIEKIYKNENYTDEIKKEEKKNYENNEDEEHFKKIKVHYYNNGKYQGEMKNGRKEGKGIFYYKNGAIYKGYFKNNLYEGKGLYCFENGDIYEGHFKKGKKEGKGIYYYNNGDIYKGDYKDDEQNGKGKFYFNDGDRYEGKNKKGYFEGKGIYYYINGNRYEGNFKKDKKEGKGIFYYNKRAWSSILF